MRQCRTNWNCQILEKVLFRNQKKKEINIELQDTEWEREYIDHDRNIARAIVSGMFYFVRAERDDEIGEAYAYIMKYAEENGYKVNGLSRECYIDGIWNKDSVDEWLTEIQLPIE